MSIDIVGENARAGTYTHEQMKTGQNHGDLSVAGFARQVSVNVGETVEFSVNGPATTIRIFRAGWYGGVGFREVGQIVNTPTEQPEVLSIPDSNGATSARNWSVTATWDVPVDAVSGMYMAMIRNADNTDAFHVTFVVRDDAAEADIIYKTSDTTWGAAYNHYGTIADPTGGRNVYGEGTGVGNIQSRCFAGSYHRPVITRGTVMQTYWWACELPIIRWLERNGYSVKYTTSVDIDRRGVDALAGSQIFLSAGHDEYWSQPMWDALVEYRDTLGKHAIFMSGNEVFWRVRFEYVDDEAIMWCRKDTMPGPVGTDHVAGQPFVPGDWQGTWIDTRWAERTPTELLTNTTFAGGMNGVYDYDIVMPFTGHKVWGGSALNDMPLAQITIAGALGFEADRVLPQGPAESYRILGSYTRSAPGGLGDENGQNYNVQGNLEWGIASRRFASGAVTVGLGTCQWGWALDDAHDRGAGVPTNQDAQQFTVNLLNDLGAEPQTLMSGVTLQAVNSLDEYGLIPGSEPDPDPEPEPEPVEGRAMRRGDEVTLQAQRLVGDVLERLVPQ